MGAGMFLRGARDYGIEGYGFEVNPWCHDFAVNEVGLSVELGLFGPDHQRTYDLIASIMVFEHLEKPRELFATMRDKLNPDGAIYLSVPFVERHEWPFLWTAGTNPADAPPDVFYDNDVHITHFSIEGMRRNGSQPRGKIGRIFRFQGRRQPLAWSLSGRSLPLLIPPSAARNLTRGSEQDRLRLLVLIVRVRRRPSSSESFPLPETGL